MTTLSAGAPARAPLTTLRHVASPLPHRAAALAAATTWDTVHEVLARQIGQDALLLWRYDRGDERLRLTAVAPALEAPRTLALAAEEPLRQLGNGGLDAVVDLGADNAAGQFDQALASLGLQAAVTALLADGEQAAYLITAAARERRLFGPDHAATVAACLKYLRVCREAALARDGRRHWWDLQVRPAGLWQQDYPPSVLRTVHDLTDTLAEAARCLRPRFDHSARGRVSTVRHVAHAAAALMTCLESTSYGAGAPPDTDELLSQALLLVRDAYHLCRGTWPGCLAVVSHRPHLSGDHAEIRRRLVDWLLDQIEAEGSAA